MAILVTECPRCGAKHMTFTVLSGTPIGERAGWQRFYELFCTCRHCERSTTFVISQKGPEYEPMFALVDRLIEYRGSLNEYLNLVAHVSIRDEVTQEAPEHVPPEIQTAFKEAATCVAVKCWNAAGAMFRMCVDLATRPMLPEGEVQGLTRKMRRDLGLRLRWLFDSGKLPGDLRGLSDCIREDGNDGAHAGTLMEEDAADLLDFTIALLERLYTEPERLKLAEARRAERRKPKE